VPLAVGTDTAGSVRVPAALCGIAGFKPAYDVLPTAGVHPLAPSLDHVGLFGRTAEDVRLAYAALLGSDAATPPGTGEPILAWLPSGVVAATDPRVETVCHEALARAGFVPETLKALPGLVAEENLFDVFTKLQSKEAFRVHEHHLDADRDLIDVEVVARLERGRAITDPDYAAADATRRRLRAAVGELLGRVDVLALPAVPVVAPRIGERVIGLDGQDLEVRSTLLSLTSPWNMTDTPALSVPAGFVDGLPVGLQLVSARGKENALFQVAQALQAATTTRPGTTLDN
jgi:aspartyl-tRNA(Asn)/glutamyl-tRNA(Gln) amidotransferase subunit A